jgi:phosphatidylglycerol lysyltransferase
MGVKIRKYIGKIIAFLILLSALLNIFSVFRYTTTKFFATIDELYSIPLATLSRTATVVISILLITTARGLFKRNKEAWTSSVILTILSILFHSFKGFNFEEMIFSVFILCLLFVSKKEFSVESKVRFNISFIRGISTSLFFFLVYYVFGAFALRNGFDEKVTVSNLVCNFLYNVIGVCSDTLMPHSRRALWFDQSIGIILIIILLFHIWRLFENYISKGEKVTCTELLPLIKKYGNDSLSYCATNSKKEHFFLEGTEGVISYSIQNNIAIASADPICDESDRGKLISAFQDEWKKRNVPSAFLAVSDKYLSLYKERRYKVLKVGEEAIVDIQKFDLEKDYTGKSGWKFRRAVRHISDLGYQFEFYTIHTLPSIYYSQLVEINGEWLKEYGGGKERGFAMTMSRLPNVSDPDCRIACAIKKEGDIPLVAGFIVYMPIYKGSGFSLDSMRKRSDSPNGLNEFLITHTIEMLKTEGYKQLSLNFVILAESLDQKTHSIFSRFGKKIIENMFKVTDIYFFAQKFHPEWINRYLVYEKIADAPKIISAILSLEGEIKIGKRIIDALKI